MRTYSHFLITAALKKACPSTPIIRSVVYLGSVATDIPLLALSVGGYVYFHHVLDWESGETFRHLCDDLFVNDPFWIVSHNFFQAPMILIIGMVTLWKINGNTKESRSEQLKYQ